MDGKNVTEITYFVSVGRKILTQLINQHWKWDRNNG